MTVLIAFLLALVAEIIGVAVGSSMNFRRFGSSGSALFGSGAAGLLAVGLMAAGGTALYIGAVLAGLLIGILIRGAAK